MSDSCTTCQYVRIVVGADDQPAMECHLNPPDPAFPVLEAVQAQEHDLELEAAGIDTEDAPPFEATPQQRYPHVDPDDWCSYHLSDDPQRWLSLLITGAVLWAVVSALLLLVAVANRLALS